MDAKLRKWLIANLGKQSLASLTSTDTAALDAASKIIELHAADGNSNRTLRAFALVVDSMQSSTRHLAYHAIAMTLDWDDRRRTWEAAGLRQLDNPGLCAFEPDRRRQAV